MDSVKRWVFGFNENAVLASGFEDAFIGICYRYNNHPIAAYDKDKCIQILIDDFRYMQDMHEEEFNQELYGKAVEYFNSTILKNYTGDNKPVFLTLYPDKEDYNE